MYKYRRAHTCIKPHALSYHRACLQSQQTTADTAGSHQLRGQLIFTKTAPKFTQRIFS